MSTGKLSWCKLGWPKRICWFWQLLDWGLVGAPVFGILATFEVAFFDCLSRFGSRMSICLVALAVVARYLRFGAADHTLLLLSTTSVNSRFTFEWRKTSFLTPFCCYPLNVLYTRLPFLACSRYSILLYSPWKSISRPCYCLPDVIIRFWAPWTYIHLGDRTAAYITGFSSCCDPDRFDYYECCRNKFIIFDFCLIWL